MSESLRNDGRIWVPKNKATAERLREGALKPSEVTENERDYYLERRYPAYGNLVPRDVASRAARERCDAGLGVNKTGKAVFLDFTRAVEKHGKETIDSKYGNLFQMYEKITGENPYKEPMQIFPAMHYTMGGLWVDYNLMTTVPGLFAIGEVNFSDHGANRLGASALMQGLADGFFILPYTLPDYLASGIAEPLPDPLHPEFNKAVQDVQERIRDLTGIQGRTPVDDLHRKLGLLMWEHAGIIRSAAGLSGTFGELEAIRDRFRKEAGIPGSDKTVNQELEKALHMEDYLLLAGLMINDALHREESCGGHFRIESQTKEGETLRNDKAFQYVAAWEYRGKDRDPVLHKETLVFSYIDVTERKYK
jgi:succinate dehydrogenase / fumarate reductase flavoprotein subunit